jgi:hypothetical protein
MFYEVRDATGSTVFLEFHIGTLNPDSSSEMGTSFQPSSFGRYEVMSFAISNFTKPDILSSLSVIDYTPP